MPGLLGGGGVVCHRCVTGEGTDCVGWQLVLYSERIARGRGWFGLVFAGQSFLESPGLTEGLVYILDGFLWACVCVAMRAGHIRKAGQVRWAGQLGTIDRGESWHHRMRVGVLRLERGLSRH